MVQAINPQNPKQTRLVRSGNPKIRRLLRELESFIESDDTAARRVLDFVKEKTKQGRGRPPLDRLNRKSVIVPIRLTVGQRETLKRFASHRGKGVSEMVRDLILVGIGKFG